jgi:branched-chain amino acid transport system permease protein
MANLSLVAPALIGVSLGRNPSGAVPQIVASYRPLWQVKWVLALGVVAEGAFYVLTLTHVIGNWWFVLATAVIVLVLPLVGRGVRPEVFDPASPGRLGAAPQPEHLAPVLSGTVPAAVEGVADARS